MKKILFVTLSSFALTGCSSFDIYDSNGESVKGIPYYVKKGVVKQTSVYSRSWVEVELEYSKIKSDGKVLAGSGNSAKFDIKLDGFNEIEVLNAFALAQSQADSGFTAAFGTFKSELDKSCNMSNTNCSIAPLDRSKDLAATTLVPSFVHQEFISNKSSYDSIVDYDNVYFFNTTVPFFGTTTGSVTLAADGTLTTGTSTVDTTKLAEVIPLNELLLKKFNLGDYFPSLITKSTTGSSKSPISIINISINKKSYQYNLIKYLPYTSGLNLKPLTFSTPNISLEIITSTSALNVPAAKSNAIKLNGTIELPENK